MTGCTTPESPLTVWATSWLYALGCSGAEEDEGFDDADDALDDPSSPASLRRALASIFLPEGYPDSVREEYALYQACDTAQALCSYLRGVLTHISPTAVENVVLRWNDETSAAPMLSSESFPQFMVDVCTAQVEIMTKGGA